MKRCHFNNWLAKLILAKNYTAITLFFNSFFKYDEEVYEWDNESTYFPEYALSYAVARLRSIAEQVGLTLEYCVEQAYIDIKERKGILYEGVFIKESNPAYKEALEKLGKV